MPASRATAFDRLAPDQRAAVELVLRQGRSYGELSELLYRGWSARCWGRAVDPVLTLDALARVTWP